MRTDSHLEFYEDRRNLARMSDILAVYAWVDPATGYCQGCVDDDDSLLLRVILHWLWTPKLTFFSLNIGF